MVAASTPERTAEVAKFNEAFKKVRLNSENLSTSDIIDLSRGLADVISIDSLPRALLLNICRYMQIRPFGTDAFIRRQIRSKMNSLQLDDALIDQEGVENLTYEELVNACHSRGIRSFGAVSMVELQKELRLWLDLHLRSEIPAVLIILSRALSMYEPEAETNKAIQQAIMALPEDVVEEVSSTVEIDGKVSTDYQKKLESLETQQEIIDRELEEIADKDTQTIGPSDVAELSDALSKLSSSNHEEATQEIKILKEDVAHLKEGLSMQSSMPEADKALELEGKLENLVNDIETELLKLGDQNVAPIQLSKSENDVITLEDLEVLLGTLRASNFSDEKITKLFQALDRDNDGKIRVKDIIELGDMIEKQKNSLN